MKTIILSDMTADKDAKTLGEVEVLGWFISTLADVFNYNEFSIIPLDLIQKWLEDVESVSTFTKEMYQKIHLEIIEAGLVTLPTSNKAIQLYGR